MSDGPSSTPRLQVTATPAAGRTRLAVAGEVDMASALELLTAVGDHLARGPVLLDLHGITFLDSSGIHVLDAIMRDVEREEWDLTIHPDLAPSVEFVLKITGLLDALPFGEATTTEDGR